MANLLCPGFQNSILLCGFGAMGSLVDNLFVFLSLAGLFVLSIVVAVVVLCRRFFRPKASEPISIFREDLEGA